MNNNEFNQWRAERLAALPPQAEESIPPLLFVQVEVVQPVCVSTICKDKHTVSLIPPNSRELESTGFQDEDSLAGEIKYVTDWPETPGGRWSDMGEY